MVIEREHHAPKGYDHASIFGHYWLLASWTCALLGQQSSIVCMTSHGGKEAQGLRGKMSQAGESRMCGNERDEMEVRWDIAVVTAAHALVNS